MGFSDEFQRALKGRFCRVLKSLMGVTGRLGFSEAFQEVSGYSRRDLETLELQRRFRGFRLFSLALWWGESGFRGHFPGIGDFQGCLRWGLSRFTWAFKPSFLFRFLLRVPLPQLLLLLHYLFIFFYL